MNWKRVPCLAAAAICLCLSACGSSAQEDAGKTNGLSESGEVLETAVQEAAGRSIEDILQEARDGGDKQEALAELAACNPDVYAWLEITGTDLSFPVLQSPEDEYFYLNHDIEKAEDPSGCIYTEYYNRKDFSDPNTILYGRNVEGRFAGLHQYQDRDFFDRYREIRVTTQDASYVYQIFAAYEYDDRHLIKIYDFWNYTIFDAYLKDVFAQRGMDTYLDDTIPVTAEDRILTLSTGISGKDDRRYLVQAVLTDA